MCLLKSEFLKKIKAIKIGTEFIIRDIAQRMGEHTEKQLISDGSKAEAHTQREDVGVLPVGRSTERCVRSLTQGSSFRSVLKNVT